jgi:hypothetical protein
MPGTRTLRPLLRVSLAAAAMLIGAAAPARGDGTDDVTAEITRLRMRLAANSAQEQHCMANATQPVWTASLAIDLKMLQDRARQAAANGSSAEAQRWKELARKAEALETQATANARTGAELFQSQQIGLDCLDRFAGEREALHASLQVAVQDPAAYGASLRLAREQGTGALRQDLARLQERSRALSAEWKKAPGKVGTGTTALQDELEALRRRHTVTLESAAARTLADPGLRAAEALVAAASASDREREATARVTAARDDAERRLAGRDRDDAGRIAREYWATADRLLGR